jgi:hypothetical protein
MPATDTPSTPISKAADTAAAYVSDLKVAGEQVLSTGKQATELYFDLAKKIIDIAVDTTPKFASAPYVPSKKDLTDLVAASFAPVEKVLSMQRSAIAALVDASPAR